MDRKKSVSKFLCKNLWLFLVMLALMGCTAPLPTSTPPANAATSIGPETPIALPTPPPTPTSVPPDANSGMPSGEATRIAFAPGETSAETRGTVAARGTNYYVLQAQEGQILSVELTSPNSEALLSVVGEDGTPYKRYQNGPPAWTSTLPLTQDYFIHVVSIGPATDYTLRVWIEPLGDNSRAERIVLAPGATSAERRGLLPSGLPLPTSYSPRVEARCVARFRALWSDERVGESCVAHGSTTALSKSALLPVSRRTGHKTLFSATVGATAATHRSIPPTCG